MVLAVRALPPAEPAKITTPPGTRRLAAPCPAAGKPFLANVSRGQKVRCR